MKSVFEMTDGELLTRVSNYEDWGEEQTLNVAAKEVNSPITYSDFFKTKTLTPDVRQELRKAFTIWDERE